MYGEASFWNQAAIFFWWFGTHGREVSHSLATTSKAAPPAVMRAAVAALRARWGPPGQQSAGVLPGFSGLGQRHVRVQVEGQQLLFAAGAILPAPALGAGHGDEKEQAAAVCQLLRLGSRLGATDSSVGQRHWGYRFSVGG
ncbi:hypothetical protein GCM10027214_04410 [Stenotrophomonas tumulicola]